MTYLLGIDLGTTRTSAAIRRSGGRPGEVVELGDRASAVPSVFYAGDDGTLLVGEAAERRAITDPSCVVREFKRRIGDPTPLVVAGVAWSPQELCARLVRWVVDRVSEREGGPAARIAVTHPASWGPLKSELLGGALATQGLQVSFLPEPQAAALHYASTERLEVGATVAVYDLGGGTFDAAVVHKDAHGLSLVGRPEGLERLGGVDFDQAVFDHVRESMPDAFANLDDSDPAVHSAVAAVRRECSEAKEALSSDTEVSIPVLLPSAQGSVRLHRSEFEAMIRPQIEETVSALRRAVVSAALTSDQLSAVLLVGGSSRIPLVAQLVSEQLGRPVTVDADPKNAIALGAASSLDSSGQHGSGAQLPVSWAGGPLTYPGATGSRPAVHSGPQNMDPQNSGSQSSWRGAAGAAAVGGLGAAAQWTGSGPAPQQLPAPSGGMPTRVGMPSRYPERPPVADPPHDPGYGPHQGYDHDYDYDYDYEQPEPPPRRSPAALVGIGGALAAVALLATVVLMSVAEPTVASAPRPSLPAATSTATPTSEPSQAPTSEVEPSEDPVEPEPDPVRPPVESTEPVPTTVPPEPTTVLPTPPTSVEPTPTPDPSVTDPTVPTSPPAPSATQAPGPGGGAEDQGP